MAKNTNTFQNDIKNYDLIRDMIRHIYMYGNYSKGDIVKNNIIGSERSVYDMLKRIENYLGGEYLQTHKLPNRKKDKNGYRFKYDPFQCPINYLADTYQNCSYVIEDFIFYFTLLQAFNPFKGCNPYKQHSLESFSEDVSELVQEKFYDYDTLLSNIHDILTANDVIIQSNNNSFHTSSDPESLITPAKARDRLNELVELGIIIKQNNAYSLAPDLFEGLEDCIEQLQLMVQFYYNFTELCIPGYYLSSTLDEYSTYMDLKVNKSFHIEQENPVFFYKNNSIQNVIDDDIFWSLLCAIDKMEPVKYKYKNKNGNVFDYEVFPIKLVIEKQYGRHYIYGYNYAYNNFIIQRLDSITSISSSSMTDASSIFCFLSSPTESPKKQLNELYLKNMKHVWNITTGEEHTNVLIHFHFPPEEYERFLSRVKATGRNGIIELTGDYSFDYTVTVQSQLEMKPWIRSFGPYALVDKDQNPALYDEIRNDYRKVLNSYGII